MRLRIHSLLSPLFLVIFLSIEYGFRTRIESSGPYTSYLIEVLFVLIVAFGWKGFRFLRSSPGWSGSANLALMFGFGIAARALCTPLEVGTPFDLSSPETILFLVVVGPILEEFVFRGVLMRLMRDIVLSRYLIILMSAIAFSYSHFQILFETPENLHGFIQYQAVYTFFLGLACGYFAVTYGLLWAILGHFLFNFGFLLSPW